MATITVDTGLWVDFPPEAIGIGISTYGKSIAKNDAQKDVLRRHGNRAYRLPIQWNNGNPISSARGGPGDISADKWVDDIHSIGGQVYMQIGGKDFDNDFNENDAYELVKRYAPRGVKMFGVGNEPNNGGWNVDQTIDLFNRCAPRMRDASNEVGVPIKIGGLVWSYYDRGRNQQFLDRCGQHLDILEWHNYAMGNPPAMGDQETLDSSPNWGRQAAEVLEDADARGLDNIIPLIGEINWAWQYKDGYDGTGDGSDTRFFQPIITTWLASVIGHTLINRGWPWQYSDQNGPLGISVEGGNTDQGKPSNIPQPVYHGVGAWTGEDVFPGADGRVYECYSDDDRLEAFAVKNTDGGANVIVINKSLDRNIDYTIELGEGNDAVAYEIFGSNDDAYADLSSKSSGTSSNARISTSVPANRVRIVVLETSNITPPPIDPEPEPGPEPEPDVVLAEVSELHSDAEGTNWELSFSGNPVRYNAGSAASGDWAAPGDGVLLGGNVANRDPLPYVVDLGNGEDISELFESEIWGEQTWTISIPENTDGVEIGLVVLEQFPDAQQIGGRLWSAVIEFGDRSVVVDDIDIYEEFNETPGILTFIVVPDAATTSVSVTLIPGSSGDNPFVNALYVQPLLISDDTGGGTDTLFDPLPNNASQSEIIDKVNDILDYLETQ